MSKKKSDVGHICLQCEHSLRHFRRCFKNTVSNLDLDLSHAYQQVILVVESKNNATLNTNKGLFTGGFKSCHFSADQ